MGKWLTPVIASPRPGQKMYIDSERMEGTQERRFPTEIDIQIRCVCVPCNNGWMSNMEGKVKPLIESLLDESERTLSQNDQLSLAVWATKTAIISRYFASEHEIPSSYLEWFYNNQKVPPNTFVWMGRYNGELAASMQTKDMLFLDLNDETLSSPHAQFVLFTVGCLVFCVLSAYVGNRISFTNGGLIGEYLRIISPYQTNVAWPLLSLDDTRRRAIFDQDWDRELIIELRQDDSPPPT